LQGPDVPGFEERYNYLYPILSPILKLIWRHAAVVTAISKEHQRLAHAFTPQQAIEIVHNGVDTSIFHPAPAPRAGTEIHIVSVGRLIERKGHHHLLRAFAELSRSSTMPLRLTLVGTGDAEQSLHDLARELHVEDRVTFSGFVPRERMPEIYHDSDIFALASQSEGMSIALLEAMASGLPVVVTDTGGVEELVQEGVNGHVVPWADVPALTAALRATVENHEARTQMGAESLRVARAFSWDAIAREYLELCQRTAEHRPTTGASR
jgi:glycosyltransferase involved in cell wall biosynthesis